MEERYKILINFLKAIIEDKVYVLTSDIKKILEALEELENE